MKLENFKIEITEKELQSAIDMKLPEDKNLSDVKLLLNDNKITISAKYKVPIMGGISLKVHIVPEIQNEEKVALHLNIMGVGGMVTGLIMKFLDSKISTLPFLTREGDSCILQLDLLLKHYDIEGNIKIQELSIRDQSVAVELKGECDLVRILHEILKK